MTVLAAAATCVALAASIYGVSPARIDAVAQRASTEAPQPGGRIGVMGIPSAWIPYLQAYGFDASAVRSDVCQNIIAGTWILATSDQIAQAQSRWAAKTRFLPDRARPWQTAVQWVAGKAGIRPALLNSVIEQESRFNPNAIGPKTRSGERAIGLMQIMPSTAMALGINPYDPAQNLWGGSWYLSNLIRRYDGNVALALAAYNAGPPAVAKYGGIPPYPETMAYVKTILSRVRCGWNSAVANTGALSQPSRTWRQEQRLSHQ